MKKKGSQEDKSERARKRKGALLTIFVFSFLSFSLVGYAFFLYFAVGDKGGPDWHFGIVEDVPGSSRYSTSMPGRFFFDATSPEEKGRVIRQHVMEEQDSARLPNISGEDPK